MKSNTLSWNDQDSQRKIVEILRQNKVVLAPSDTVWGLCAVPSKETFAELNTLKVRNDKPYLLLARDPEAIAQYAVLPEDSSIQYLMHAFWPGPLTIIFKAQESAPEYLVSSDGTVAFRIPCHEGLQHLLSQVPVLFSTSANISGEPVPLTYASVALSIKNKVALAVVPELGDEPQSALPSTIIDVSKGAVSLVREGAISWRTLQDALHRNR